MFRSLGGTRRPGSRDRVAEARVKLAGICGAILSVFCLLAFAAGPAAASSLTATTDPGQLQNTTTFTANGTIHATGAHSASYYFEYGPTTAYGQQTATNSDNGPSGGDVMVNAPVSGLQANSTYHFQLVVVDQSQPSGAPILGGDETITTANEWHGGLTVTIVPANPEAFQPITDVVTFTASPDGSIPEGTVNFANDSDPNEPVGSCSNVPVINSNGTFVASCASYLLPVPDTGFTVTSGYVSASFQPSPGGSPSGAGGSIFPTAAEDASTTTVSGPSSAAAGSAVTYTATTTFQYPIPAGYENGADVALEGSPGQSLLVDGKASQKCAFPPSVTADSITTACPVTFPTGGQHDVTVEYVDHNQASPPNSFTSSTSAPLTVTVSGSGSGPSSGSGTVTLAKPKTSGATLRILASCAAGGPSCVDQYQVSVTEKLHKGKVVGVTASQAKPAKTTKVVVLGSAKVTLAAGQSTTVKLTLNGAGKKLLAKHRALKTKLTVTAKNGSKTQTLKTAKVTFKALSKHKG